MTDNGVNEIIIYQDADGKPAIEVTLDQDTVWLNLSQMVMLFERDKSVISRHLKNVFSSDELSRNSVVAFFATTASDGKTYKVEYFNLDAIISVGYRVNSKRGIQFRQWATKTLRDHLVKGYTINQQRLNEQNEKLQDLRKTVTLLEQTIAQQEIGLDEAKGLLAVITDYAYALTTLDRYDHGTLDIRGTTGQSDYILEYPDRSSGQKLPLFCKPFPPKQLQEAFFESIETYRSTLETLSLCGSNGTWSRDNAFSKLSLPAFGERDYYLSCRWRHAAYGRSLYLGIQLHHLPQLQTETILAFNH